MNPMTALIERAYDEARPMTVQLELTYKCNLLCSFCYNAPLEKTELTAGEWLTTLDKLKDVGTFTISLTGGEPMCHRDFFEIAAGVRDRGFVLKTYTNGVLLADPAKAERYAELAPFDTEISLHGAEPATHDRLTGIRGSFDKLMLALENMSRLGLKVTLKTPITRLNQHQLRDVEDVGRRFGYHVTFDTNIVPTDDGDLSPLGLAADREFMVQFFVDQVKRGARGLNPRPVKKMKQNCGVGRTTMAINPYGDIFPCIAWRRAVGNVREVESLKRLWNGGGNETLDYVRTVADNVPKRTLADREEGGFVAFCPAVAEKETGDPYAYYPGAKASGLTKLTAYKRLNKEPGGSKPQTASKEGLASSTGTA